MVKLDKKDLQILHELDIDSRQPNSVIARKVKLSEQVVGYRIKRMSEQGIIKKFIAILNPSRLGYTHYKIFLRFQNISVEEEKKFVSYLVNHPSAFWVASSRGRYDLVFSIYAKNIHEFSDKYNEISNLYGKFVLEKDVAIVASGASFTRHYFSQNSTLEELPYGGEFEPVKLDKEDESILSLLSNDARISLLDLSEKLKLSPDAVSYRIKNLKKKEVITGFRILIDFNLLDRAYYMVLFNLQNVINEKHTSFKHFAKSHKVLYFINCIGPHDLEFEMEVKNDEELNIILREFRDEFRAELKNYETLKIVEEHKLNFYPFK